MEIRKYMQKPVRTRMLFALVLICFTLLWCMARHASNSGQAIAAEASGQMTSDETHEELTEEFEGTTKLDADISSKFVSEREVKKVEEDKDLEPIEPLEPKSYF